MSSVFVRSAIFGDEEAIAHVHVATWRDAFRGIMPDNILNDLSVAERAKHWHQIINYNQSTDMNVLFVAIRNNVLCGFAACGKSRSSELADYGELYALYVLPEHQKHGCGKELFRHAKSFFLKKEFRKTYVWVLQKNLPARHVYEKWGAKENENYSKTTHWGEAELVETAYIWEW